MGKVSKADAAALQSVDTYLARIETLLNQHARLNRSAEKLVHDADKGGSKAPSQDKLQEALEQREGFKNSFIRFKQSCNTEIDKLSDEKAKAEKRAELRRLQERYRALREDFKAYGVESYVQATERDQLFEGAARRAQAQAAGIGGTDKGKNSAMLDEAQRTAKNTTSMLREGLTEMHHTQATADQVAVTLAEDREKIERISHNVDEIDSDLSISQKLLTRFIKRLYTDKIIIAFTCLIVCAVAGIIIYSAVEPSQSTFNVPDNVKPPTKVP